MRTTATFVALVASVLIAPQAEARTAFEDNKLNFRSCDGKNLTARWRENEFHLSVPGKTLDASAPALKYMGWDGHCWTLTVGDKGEFVHFVDGKTQSNHIIKYVGWDDSKWSATRAGGGFFQMYIAGKGETPDGAMHDAAAWLHTNKSDSRAAERLAHELGAASKQ